MVDLVVGGFSVLLDERQVKTPAKALLRVPTLRMAEAIAAEWDAQVGLVDPRTMPVTRSANAAIDKVAVQFDEVAGLIAAYGATDHLCYRAAAPTALQDQQAEAWDPILAWAAAAFSAPLMVTTGLVHIDQPAGSLANLRRQVFDLEPFALTSLSDLVGLSGSLVLGLAVAAGVVDPAAAWTMSRIDEDYQADIWGRDSDAVEAAARKAADFAHAARFYALTGEPS